MNEPVTQAAALRELMRTLIRKLGLLERSEATCCAMTFSQCTALVEIGRGGFLSVNQLAERLDLDKSTVSRSSDKLVADGLLLREEDPNDRRYVVLKLSDKGLQIYRDIEQRMADYFETVIADINPKERQQLLVSLQLLTEAIKSKECC